MNTTSSKASALNPSRRLFLTAGASALTLTLAGCFAGTPPLTYDLTSSAQAPVRRRSSRIVVVTLPEVVQTYDTQRVVVREPGNVLSYLPEAQWSDTLPRLIQTRMLQTFEESRFPNIGRPDDQLNVDVTLATEVREFEINVAGETTANVTLSAKLVDENNRRIYANEVFSASVPARVSPTSGAISALDAALQDVMGQIVVWAAKTA